MTANVDVKKVILVTGPESSGTRVLTSILSRHPGALGAESTDSHADVLDETWRYLEKGLAGKARGAFPATSRPVVVTRRSLPHGIQPGKAAKFGQFADLDSFARIVESQGRRLILLVTARNPIANLSSWTRSRSSAGGDIGKALAQYQSAFVHVFDFISRTRTPFLLVPLESLLLDGIDYVNCLLRSVELSPLKELPFELRRDVNKKHFEWFSNHGVCL